MLSYCASKLLKGSEHIFYQMHAYSIGKCHRVVSRIRTMLMNSSFTHYQTMKNRYICKDYTYDFHSQQHCIRCFEARCTLPVPFDL